MTDLETVKLPLGLAQNSGIAKDAFKGCTNPKFKTIEFVLDNVSNLATLDPSSSSSNINALANIYKMFAGGDNSFGDNGDGVIQTPTLEKL